MLDLDAKEIEKKLDEERPHGKGIDNQLAAEAMLRYHPNLYNAIKDWLNGNDKADYEFMGISIQMLSQRYFYGWFLGACAEMNSFLNHPEWLEEHKENIIDYLDNLYAEE